MIYWLTGQPSHGKTILAKLLVKHHEKSNIKLFHIDGDDLRKLTINQNYSEEGRIQNVRTAQKISDYLHNQNFDVVVSLVSPYRWLREEFKEKLGENIKEFYIHTTEPRERDHFKVKDYEPPLDNFISIDTTEDNPEESLIKILSKIT
jgi:adenylylsulfate kinase|tara:strand:- start:13857 stop:14300 length:444 start_codon:yes stop_codon:yes gene_type:complete